MIVRRYTYTVKFGKAKELAAVLKAEKERVDYPYAVRVYAPDIGPPSNIVVEEMECESWEKWLALTEGWLGTPEFAEYIRKCVALMEPPVSKTTETWELL